MRVGDIEIIFLRSYLLFIYMSSVCNYILSFTIFSCDINESAKAWYSLSQYGDSNVDPWRIDLKDSSSQ